MLTPAQPEFGLYSYIYIYIYMYIYIYICIHIYPHTSLSLSLSLYIYVYIHISGRNGTQKRGTANCQHNCSKEASPNTKANTGNFTGMKCELIRTTIASYARQGHRTLLGKGLGAWVSNAMSTSKGQGDTRAKLLVLHCVQFLYHVSPDAPQVSVQVQV